MRFHVFRDWLLSHMKLSKRLKGIILWYVISLMVITRKHSLDHAASISGKEKSRFSRMLKDHPNTAVSTLEDLSRREAKKYSHALEALKGLPWKVAIIIDLTDQGRSSRHPENVAKLNHGKGYFVGHQWTNIILLMGDHIVPLPPIAYHSRRYCREKKMEYQTEHKKVVDYLKALNLEEYIEGYRPEDVVVLADSGYDDKRIQNVIGDREWEFIMALKKQRSVKSNPEHLSTKPSEGWRRIDLFFKAHRRLEWQTIRLFTNGARRKRKEFRIGHTIGWLKSVGPVQMVCSERKQSPKGERKYPAGSHLTLNPGPILIGYSLRWRIELFHKSVKMHLGFQDVSTVSFDSVTSHVHWTGSIVPIRSSTPIFRGSIPR